MSTEFPYLQIDTPKKKALVGKPDKGTRIYRREGTYKESGEWFVAIDELFDDQFVSPGGVCMFVPSSRASVHKRLKEGRLTAFCFHVVHSEKTFFGNLRKAKATPFIAIPVSECKAWARELEEQRSKPERDTGDAYQLLSYDPEDRKNRKVRYTDEYLDKAEDEEIMRIVKENAEHRTKKKRQQK